MSIKSRLALLLGFLLLGFLAAWMATQRIEQREVSRMLADARSSRVQTLNHWIDLTGRSLPQFAADYGQGDALAKLVSQPAPDVLARIAQDLKQAGVSELWVLRSDGTPQFSLDQTGQSAGEPPLSPPDFTALVESTPSPHFYAEQERVPVELAVRRLAPSTGDGSPRWLMVARTWDAAHLQTLAGLTESKITLIAPSANARTENDDHHTVVLRPLPDSRGRDVRVLRVEHGETDLANMTQADSRSVRVFLAFGLLVIAAVGLALQLWVLRPLRRIGDSLTQKDPSVLGTLKSEPTELGHVARLVEFSFAQTEALRKSEATLRQTMDERARLGWNLHDGVIQSLYAAGMGLSGVHSLLGPEQNVAASRLEQVRGILNETIHDVRNFITGLEPEALKQQSFGGAVAGVLATMKTIRSIRTTLEIDEALSARLTLPERIHVLQFVREAVSNALRHGEPAQIGVTLRTQNGKAEFEVSDDGSGFDPAIRRQGSGLANLAERARELGAHLAIDSSVGKGTRIKLIFPSPPSYD